MGFARVSSAVLEPAVFDSCLPMEIVKAKRLKHGAR
jgi:hypothetical protein